MVCWCCCYAMMMSPCLSSREEGRGPAQGRSKNDGGGGGLVNQRVIVRGSRTGVSGAAVSATRSARRVASSCCSVGNGRVLAPLLLLPLVVVVLAPLLLLPLVVVVLALPLVVVVWLGVLPVVALTATVGQAATSIAAVVTGVVAGGALGGVPSGGSRIMTSSSSSRVRSMTSWAGGVLGGSVSGGVSALMRLGGSCGGAAVVVFLFFASPRVGT
mmetsp:Transcript_27039/g.83002  ORF Transcript_27039/g.83002 Transcript_27039/m.83002 type:complete len:215 (+) Transcript_27039:1251-1895(+)